MAYHQQKIDGYAGSAEARATRSDITARAAGAQIAELATNASMERGGPKHDAPANA